MDEKISWQIKSFSLDRNKSFICLNIVYRAQAFPEIFKVLLIRYMRYSLTYLDTFQRAVIKEIIKMINVLIKCRSLFIFPEKYQDVDKYNNKKFRDPHPLLFLLYLEVVMEG